MGGRAGTCGWLDGWTKQHALMADGVCCLPGCRSRKVLPSPLLSTPCAAPLGPCLQEADEAFGAIEYALGEQLAQLGDADPEFRQMWQDTLGDTRTSFLDMVSAGWVGGWVGGWVAAWLAGWMPGLPRSLAVCFSGPRCSAGCLDSKYCKAGVQ